MREKRNLDVYVEAYLAFSCVLCKDKNDSGFDDYEIREGSLEFVRDLKLLFGPWYKKHL